MDEFKGTVEDVLRVIAEDEELERVIKARLAGKREEDGHVGIVFHMDPDDNCDITLNGNGNGLLAGMAVLAKTAAEEIERKDGMKAERVVVAICECALRAMREEDEEGETEW